MVFMFLMVIVFEGFMGGVGMEEFFVVEIIENWKVYYIISGGLCVYELYIFLVYLVVVKCRERCLVLGLFGGCCGWCVVSCNILEGD